MTLPTYLQAVGWSAVAILAAPLAAWLRSRLTESALAAAARFEPFAPWAYGLLPSFAAMWTGAVPAIYMGVYGGRTLISWIAPALVLIVLLLLLSAWLGRQPIARPAGLRFDRVILDEPRWALYRATGALIAGSLPWGILIGLGLGAVEWAVARRLWVQENRGQPLVCLEIGRLATSAMAFAISGNLWLTMAYQVGWLSLLDPQLTPE